MFPVLKERYRTAADYLSGGEQQMLAVARALSGNVRLLLLDEPFEGLAPAVTQELFTVFDQLRRHLPILIVEHNLDQIGRAHVCTPVTTAHLVCRLLLEEQKTNSTN